MQTPQMCEDMVSGEDSTLNVPPSRLIRSRIPSRPKCPEPVPEACGGDVRIENRVLGEDRMVIKKPKFGTLQSPYLYRLETKVFYTGKLVDVVTNSFSVQGTGPSGK